MERAGPGRPRSAKNRSVRRGYSVVTRAPGRIASTVSAGSAAWTATTIRTVPSPVLE